MPLRRGSEYGVALQEGDLHVPQGIKFHWIKFRHLRFLGEIGENFPPEKITRYMGHVSHCTKHMYVHV